MGLRAYMALPTLTWSFPVLFAHGEVVHPGLACLVPKNESHTIGSNKYDIGYPNLGSHTTRLSHPMFLLLPSQIRIRSSECYTLYSLANAVFQVLKWRLGGL